MEQRPLRLGDLVDDYCPRERRLTNHAIVAIVGDEIRQTRCNTCEAEHVFKGGKVPLRKKKDATGVLYDQVLANVTAGTIVAPPTPVVEPAPALVAADPTPPTPPASPASPAPPEEAWTLHRTLIRASLPRTDNTPPTPRPIPEFTMHQRNVRGSHMFRSGGLTNDRQSNGNGSFGPPTGNGHARGGFRGGEGQPGVPNGPRPGGGRRRRRSKKPRPTN